jgi:hypothetical protein
MQGPAISALQQQLCPVAAGPARHWGIDRSEYANSGTVDPGDASCGDFEESMCVVPVMCGRTNQGKPREGRPSRRSSFFQRVPGNPRITAFDQPLPEWMRRKRGLNEHLAHAALAPGAPGDLDN